MEEFGSLQAWLVIGIPVLGVCVGLFLTRNPRAALLAYALLTAGFLLLATVDRVAGAVFGALLPLLYAAGRGGPAEQPARPPGERSDDDAWRYSSEAEAGITRR
jgi:hypothetical protein